MNNDLIKTVREKANFLYSIADILTGDYKPHQYGDVMLPMVVLKRFDDVLRDTKKDVIEGSKKYPITFAKRDFLLKQISKNNFYNTSVFDFKNLLNDHFQSRRYASAAGQCYRFHDLLPYSCMVPGHSHNKQKPQELSSL